MEALFFEDKTGGEHEVMNVPQTPGSSKRRIHESIDGSEEVSNSLSRKKNISRKKAKRIDDIFASLEPKEVSKKKTPIRKNKHEADIGEDTYVDLGGEGSEVQVISDVDELMNKSVITPGFGQLHAIPPYEVSQQMARKARKIEREKTKGSKWFNLPAPEMTGELKKELQVLQMRSVLDPKHFYKKNTMKTLPKYFQVGRIVEAPADFYHSRVPKKQRKKTIVEELLADAEFKKYNKKRYTEIIEEKRKTNFKAHKHAKRLKNRKK